MTVLTIYALYIATTTATRAAATTTTPSGSSAATTTSLTPRSAGMTGRAASGARTALLATTEQKLRDLGRGLGLFFVLLCAAGRDTFISIYLFHDLTPIASSSSRTVKSTGWGKAWRWPGGIFLRLLFFDTLRFLFLE